MRKLLLFIFAFVTIVSYSQSKGKVTGFVKDKDMGLEPLPFVSVYVEGNSSVGTTTDFDGNYNLPLLPGKHVLVYDFVGYKAVKKEVDVEEDKTINISVVMEALASALDAVVLKTTRNKESESVLLTEQKEAAVIIESIGAERLSKQGVSNAAAATTKITGVTRSESSGDVFIRGLGDRYLLTTMNGLPIPSDDVEKKNIGLNLFPTGVIQNIGVTKTYSTDSYSDQASGHVNIVSKEYTNSTDKVKVGFSVNSNTNVLGVFDGFKRTQNVNNTNFGYYKSDLTTQESILGESWNTELQPIPLDYRLSLNLGDKFDVNDDHQMSYVVALSHARSYDYADGIFKSYRGNSLNNDFSSVEEFNTSINTTGLLDLKYEFNADHSLKFTTLYINKLDDNLYEQGRDGLGFVFDQQPAEYGAFVRDQNTKQTTILVNQLFGDHFFGEKDKLNWAFGLNNVSANEPNRIRNEVNFGTDENNSLFAVNNVVSSGLVEFAFVGGFQQRKSSQIITDQEYNSFVKYEHLFVDEEDKKITLNIGGDYRHRTRDFESQFQGVITTAQGINNDFFVTSIDNLSAAFTQENFDSGDLSLNDQQADTYTGELDVKAAHVSTRLKFASLDMNLGIRYEQDVINLPSWDVGNFSGRVGSLNSKYENILPSISAKQQFNKKNSVRLVASKTFTLPEFKELAPFNYVSPTGRVTRGNNELKPSTNYNFDAKWEYYPSKSELISVTGFYKLIEDPINRSLTRGSAGVFTYDNTGEKANVYGLEAELRKNIYDAEDFGLLSFKANGTFMLHNQSLIEEFQYFDVTESGLVGAPNFISNCSLNFNDEKDHDFNANVSMNYSSDKIFALGAPEDQTNSSTLFNDQIIEKGFITLDLIFTKKFSDKFSMKGSFRNLLNPEIKQTQDVTTTRTGTVTHVVSSYQKGIDLGLSFNYIF